MSSWLFELGAEVLVLLVLVLRDTEPVITEPGKVDLRAPVDTFGAVEMSISGTEDLATEVLKAGDPFRLELGAITVELDTWKGKPENEKKYLI